MADRHHLMRTAAPVRRLTTTREPRSKSVAWNRSTRPDQMGHVTKGFQYRTDDQHRKAARQVHLSRDCHPLPPNHLGLGCNRQHKQKWPQPSKARPFSRAEFEIGCSGDLLPPSPPAEKATARYDQTGQASTSDWANSSSILRFEPCIDNVLCLGNNRLFGTFLKRCGTFGQRR